MKRAILLLTCLLATSANAALISFTDRAVFEAASSPLIIEDFESFVIQAEFRSSTLDLGDFSLSTSGVTSTDWNYIDIPPLSSSETNVNGTTHMRVFTNLSLSNDLTFLFDSAIMSFGADFRSLNDSSARTQLLVDGEPLVLPIAGDSREFSFFGFTSDTAFTSITFQGLKNDVYGIDNVTYSVSEVSEPSTIAFFLIGASLSIRRRKRTA